MCILIVYTEQIVFKNCTSQRYIFFKFKQKIPQKEFFSSFCHKNMCNGLALCRNACIFVKKFIHR